MAHSTTVATLEQLPPPSLPKKRKVSLPENEELAGKLLEKYRSMVAEQPGGLSEDLGLALSAAYRGVCGSTQPIRTPDDLLRTEGVRPWVVNIMKDSFPQEVNTEGVLLAMPPRYSNESFQEAYEVVLILDDRGTYRHHDRSDVADNISSMFYIPVKMKRLPVGDAIWIARHKVRHMEYVLDFIVGKKNVGDLVGSIRDNRHKDQQLRMKKCGLKKLIYLIEGDPNTVHASESIKTACFTTEILEGFDVQRTTGYSDTERKYGHLTCSIIDYYNTHFSVGADTCRLCLTYDEFVRRCSELEKVTLSDVFALQLMQVPHATEEAVLDVTSLYPTLLSLAQAYSMLDGDMRAQEEMLMNNCDLVKAGASKAIFWFVWAE
uniref:Uncharacterized protein n=1 Tax=Avena sativa TaxID=4498 RepID=A0ACD5XFQ4_AVESA